MLRMRDMDIKKRDAKVSLLYILLEECEAVNNNLHYG